MVWFGGTTVVWFAMFPDKDLTTGGTEKVLKPDSVPGAGVPTKKFFNNIESKS